MRDLPRFFMFLDGYHQKYVRIAKLTEVCEPNKQMGLSRVTWIKYASSSRLVSKLQTVIEHFSRALSNEIVLSKHR